MFEFKTNFIKVHSRLLINSIICLLALSNIRIGCYLISSFFQRNFNMTILRIVSAFRWNCHVILFWHVFLCLALIYLKVKWVPLIRFTFNCQSDNSIETLDSHKSSWRVHFNILQIMFVHINPFHQLIKRIDTKLHEAS